MTISLNYCSWGAICQVKLLFIYILFMYILFIYVCISISSVMIDVNRISKQAEHPLMSFDDICYVL